MCKLCTLKTKITLLREIKENLDKENRDKPCSLIRRLSLIKMATLPQIYKFNEAAIKF